MQEFDFIRQIKKKFTNNWEGRIGNDCALFEIQGRQGLITKDLLVEGKHFYPEIPIKALAYKSLAVNISDIYADGGSPRSFVIGIGAPKSAHKKIKQLYQYYAKYCQQWNIPIIGGDTVASPVFFISVTCIGDTNDFPWLRKNAQVNDWLYVTGTLGSSAYGLQKISEKGHSCKDLDIKRHLFPPLKTAVVKYLQGKVHAATDISDGFLQDLSRILEESNVGVVLDYKKIPFSKTLPVKEREQYAFYGGEDYELLFTTSLELDEKDFFQKTGCLLTKIGQMTRHKNRIQFLQNNKLKQRLLIRQIQGFDHWI